jgi:hypothetical protein
MKRSTFFKTILASIAAFFGYKKAFVKYKGISEYNAVGQAAPPQDLFRSSFSMSLQPPEKPITTMWREDPVYIMRITHNYKGELIKKEIWEDGTYKETNPGSGCQA